MKPVQMSCRGRSEWLVLRAMLAACIDPLLVVLAPKHVVNEDDEKFEPAGVFGLELAGLEFDHDEAR